MKEEKIGSVLLEKGIADRNLYETKDGYKLWLNHKSYLDLEIIKSGIWEDMSTKVVRKIVKPGNVVLDVGANIGYYSVIMSKIVGNTGKVIAFEPTAHYGDVLLANLKANDIDNCEVCRFGLSDANVDSNISIGNSSATLHWVGRENEKKGTEVIKLRILDEIVDSLNIIKLDFIKIDVDGHEPAFLRGAQKTIEKYDPIILLEVSHLNYLEMGVTAWDFYEYLKSMNMNIYFEDDGRQCENRVDFLKKCGNFAYSANIIISKKELNL